MATSLRPLQSEMSSLDWPTTKKPVISNGILVISRRSVFICIYSNFCPKIGCHSNAPLSLVYGSVTDEFPDCTNIISKPNSASMCRLQLKLRQFLWFLGLFWWKFGCHGNAHWAFAIRNVFFGLANHINPVISTGSHVLDICLRNAFLAILVPNLVAMVMPLCPLCTGVSHMNSLIAETLSQKSKPNTALIWCIHL